MTTPDPTLKKLAWLVGNWTTEATHPAMPGVTVHGTATIEWLEGEQFLIIRARTDHPQFPDSISIIGFVDRSNAGDGPSGARELKMHYYDSRGVFRDYSASIDDHAWTWWGETREFAQRFTGTRADGGKTIVGLSQMSKDRSHWDDDLAITYRRAT